MQDWPRKSGYQTFDALVPRQVVGQSKSRILFADDGPAAATKSSIRSVSYLKETSPSQPATNRLRFVSALCQQNPRTRTPSPIAAWAVLDRPRAPCRKVMGVPASVRRRPDKRHGQVLDIRYMLDNALPVRGPRIDAESEVSSRCAHVRLFLPQSSSASIQRKAPTS